MGFEARLVGDEKAKGTVEIYCRIARSLIEYVGSVDRITRESVLNFRDLLKLGKIPESKPLNKEREQNTMVLYTEAINSFMVYLDKPIHIKPPKHIEKEVVTLESEQVLKLVTCSGGSKHEFLNASNKAISYLLAEGASRGGGK